MTVVDGVCLTVKGDKTCPCVLTNPTDPDSSCICKVKPSLQCLIIRSNKKRTFMLKIPSMSNVLRPLKLRAVTWRGLVLLVA